MNKTSLAIALATAFVCSSPAHAADGLVVDTSVDSSLVMLLIVGTALLARGLAPCDEDEVFDHES